jgi:hypothetical protein
MALVMPQCALPPITKQCTLPRDWNAAATTTPRNSPQLRITAVAVQFCNFCCGNFWCFCVWYRIRFLSVDPLNMHHPLRWQTYATPCTRLRITGTQASLIQFLGALSHGMHRARQGLIKFSKICDDS